MRIQSAVLELFMCSKGRTDARKEGKKEERREGRVEERKERRKLYI